MITRHVDMRFWYDRSNMIKSNVVQDFLNMANYNGRYMPILKQNATVHI